jgi:hypothetical protein
MEVLRYLDVMTLPLKMDVVSENPKETAELLKLETHKQLHENISNHVVGRAILQHDVTLGDGLMDEVKVNINVFGAAMECGILGKVNCTLVVTVKCSRYCKRENRQKFSK